MWRWVTTICISTNEKRYNGNNCHHQLSTISTKMKIILTFFSYWNKNNTIARINNITQVSTHSVYLISTQSFFNWTILLNWTGCAKQMWWCVGLFANIQQQRPTDNTQGLLTWLNYRCSAEQINAGIIIPFDRCSQSRVSAIHQFCYKDFTKKQHSSLFTGFYHPKLYVYNPATCLL